MGDDNPCRSREPSLPDCGGRTSAEEWLGASSFPIVGIGASAGGLEAFTQLLQHLPADTGMAFVLVQHLDPKHESKLGNILAKTTTMPLAEVTDGMAVQPNCVYVIPHNTTMTIAGGILTLTPRGEARGPHLPVDKFLKSLADDQRSAAVGVILSGTGSDGTLGLDEIKAAGGITFAQDKETSKYSGMPQSAIASGAVDFVLPPQEIARELARIGHHSYLARPVPAARDDASDGEDEQFRKILALLRAAFGVDFTQYRDTTIRRRTMRRMVLHSKETLADYVRQLEADRSELQALYQDILINVTSFFRDPEIFQVLKETVFPQLMKTKTPQTPIRIWAAGCSTGQEAYSLAITLTEFLDDKPVHPAVQIFASDLSDTVSLEKARQGVYPESIEGEVSPERLRRFFTKEDGRYRIIKSIRDVCVFAKHNLASDPPFSRLDLVSCRNVLIYLAPPLQKRVIPTLHYALNPTGFLMLGTSESVGSFSDLFAVVDKTHRIYAKRATALRQYPHFNAESYLQAVSGDAKSTSQQSATVADWQKEADRIVLGHYAPAGVLVSESLEILQFRGRTSPYLEPAPGTPSLNLLKMAREGLFVELNSALQEAKKDHTTAERRDVRLRDGDAVREVNLKVVPVQLPGMVECCFLVLFEEDAQPAGPNPAEGRRATAHRTGKRAGSGWLNRLVQALRGDSEPDANLAPPDERDREIRELRREVTGAREHQRVITEQHDAANEELKSANEEILSSNEELQSTNEELETAKEELQSVNEELTTVNEQLQNRNLELSQLNNDLTNFIGSATIPIVMLGSDLRIRRFTPTAAKLLNLLAADIGRPIADISAVLDLPDFEALLEEVIETVRLIEREVQDREGRWYQLRLHPYRTADNTIDGVVIVLFDINDTKSSQIQLKEARDFARAVVETVREPLLILGGDLRVKSANKSFYVTFQATPEETENQFIYDLGNRQWNIPKLREALEDVLPADRAFEDFEVDAGFPVVGRKVMLLNARRIVRDDDVTSLILLAFHDITERRLAETRVESSERRFRRLFEAARDGIVMLDANTRRITDVNAFLLEYLGCKRDELLGKELWEIGLFADADASRAAFRELQENGYLRYDDLLLETKEGARREVEVVCNLYREDDHDVIQCNVRDITERRRAENVATRLAAIVKSSDDAIIGKDLDGIITNWNRGAEQIFGYTAEEAIGQSVAMLIPPGQLDEDPRILERIRRGEAIEHYETVRRRKDGTLLDVSLSVSPIVDARGKVVGASKIARDITERKVVEKALRDADRRKNEFLAMLAHELRNPLAAINNAVQLSMRPEVDADAAAWSKDVIKRQVTNLAHLVDDLLDVSRITQGKVELRKEPTELGPLLTRAVGMVEHHIRDRNHDLSVSLPREPLWLEADPTRLEQVISNLLANAAKYTERGGRIELAAEREGQEAVIAVRDSGVGIARDMLPHVFELFTQVERSSDRAQGGLGIGLTIVRSLVEMHGGSVTAASTPGEGSVFTVRLPLIQGLSAKRVEPSNGAAASPTPRRILIVDDNPDTAQSLARLLKSAGHRVKTVHDGPSAISEARADPPDIMLLDIGLPGMDGYEVAARVREDGCCGHTVIIGVSGYGDETAQTRSRGAGFNHLLVKPVDLETLFALIEEMR